MKLSLLLPLATGALAFTVPPLIARQDNGTAPPPRLPDDMDGTAIHGLLLDIRHFTNDLAESLQKYRGNQSALYYNATMLLRTLHEGLPVVRAHPTLALRDALRLITPVKSIAQGGRRLRAAAVRRRPRVRRERMCETVREYVLAYHDLGLLLNEAIIEKLPAGVMRVLAPYLAGSVTRHLVAGVVEFSRDKCRDRGWRKVTPPPVTPDTREGSTRTADGTASTTGLASSKVKSTTVSASPSPTGALSSEPVPSSTASPKTAAPKTAASKTAAPATTDVDLVDTATTASPSTVSPSTASRLTTAAPSIADMEDLDSVD